MDTKKDDHEARPSTPTYVLDPMGQQVAIDMILTKYFPNDCIERRDLLEVNKTLKAVADFSFDLWMAVKQVEAVQEIPHEEKMDILGMGHSLKDSAAECADEKKRRFFERAGEVLMRVYSFHLSFEGLRKAAHRLRDGVASKSES